MRQSDEVVVAVGTALVAAVLALPDLMRLPMVGSYTDAEERNRVRELTLDAVFLKFRMAEQLVGEALDGESIEETPRGTPEWIERLARGEAA